jgi:Asp-tRNA(Asn)/Glu-tRNA(Gln) amidotransferase A subunit family amidase
MTTLATVSDIGGSIRVPSSYCGVVGLKPSYGRVPEATFTYAMNICNQNGAMARSVSDCALMFNVINGPHAVDPATVKPKLILPNEFASVKGMRVAVSHDLGYFNISEDVRRNTARVANALRDAGAIVEEVDLNWGTWVRDTFTHYLGFLLGIPLAKGIQGCEDRTSYYVQTFANFAQHITIDQFLDTSEQIGRMHSALQAVFENNDVFICPTMANTSTPAEGVAKAHDNLLDSALTYPFNLLSRHPVLALPSGLANNGVPTGVQVVGRTFDEITVMQVGAAIERQIPWAYPK